MVRELKEFGCSVDVFDPVVDKIEAKLEYNIDLVVQPKGGSYDAIVIAVGHSLFKKN